jgi:hypothetical protein
MKDGELRALSRANGARACDRYPTEDRRMNNPWKMTAIGMALVAATAVVTGLVVAGKGGREIDRRADSPSASPLMVDATPRPLPDGLPIVPAPVTAPAPGVTASAPAAAPAPPAPATPKRVSSVPSQSAITACNNQAQIATKGEPNKTKEVLKDSAIGGLGGAAVGALGGAIVKGGSGAGKGAAIGGLLGAGGGALYGLNKAKENDAAYKAAYARCMKNRGYTS